MGDADPEVKPIESQVEQEAPPAEATSPGPEVTELPVTPKEAPVSPQCNGEDEEEDQAEEEVVPSSEGEKGEEDPSVPEKQDVEENVATEGEEPSVPEKQDVEENVPTQQAEVEVPDAGEKDEQNSTQEAEEGDVAPDPGEKDEQSPTGFDQEQPDKVKEVSEESQAEQEPETGAEPAEEPSQEDEEEAEKAVIGRYIQGHAEEDPTESTETEPEEDADALRIRKLEDAETGARSMILHQEYQEVCQAIDYLPVPKVYALQEREPEAREQIKAQELELLRVLGIRMQIEANLLAACLALANEESEARESIVQEKDASVEELNNQELHLKMAIKALRNLQEVDMEESDARVVLSTEGIHGLRDMHYIWYSFAGEMRHARQQVEDWFMEVRAKLIIQEVPARDRIRALAEMDLQARRDLDAIEEVARQEITDMENDGWQGVVGDVPSYDAMLQTFFMQTREREIRALLDEHESRERHRLRWEPTRTFTYVALAKQAANVHNALSSLGPPMPEPSAPQFMFRQPFPPRPPKPSAAEDTHPIHRASTIGNPLVPIPPRADAASGKPITVAGFHLQRIPTGARSVAASLPDPPTMMDAGGKLGGHKSTGHRASRHSSAAGQVNYSFVGIQSKLYNTLKSFNNEGEGQDAGDSGSDGNILPPQGLVLPKLVHPRPPMESHPAIRARKAQH